MGLQYRRSASLGNGARLNTSMRGMSVSQRVGPLSMSSRGRVSVRLAPGFSYRAKKGDAAWVALAVLAVMALMWLVKVAAILLWQAALALAWVSRWAWFGVAALWERTRTAKSPA